MLDNMMKEHTCDGVGVTKERETISGEHEKNIMGVRSTW